MTMPLANPELLPYLEPVDELVSALKTRAQTAEAQVASLQTQVSGDASTLAGDDSHIAALTSQVTELGEQIASLSVLVPTRTMVDGAASIIPLVPASLVVDFVVAGPAWKAKDIAAAQARFPNAVILNAGRNVTTETMLEADVLDDELKLTGGFGTDLAAMVAACPVYAAGHLRLKGYPGVIYYASSNEQAILNAVGDIPFYRWVANHTGKEHQWPGADITQWDDTSSGGAFGRSTVHNGLILREAA